MLETIGTFLTEESSVLTDVGTGSLRAAWEPPCLLIMHQKYSVSVTVGQQPVLLVSKQQHNCHRKTRA